LAGSFIDNYAVPKAATPNLHFANAMKYWEMIADKLASEGRTGGVVSYFDGDGRKMICADAH